MRNGLGLAPHAGAGLTASWSDASDVETSGLAG
jgi:hypothetical protein